MWSLGLLENLTLTGLAAINGMGNSLANHIQGTVADTGLTTADLILDFTQGEDRIDLSLLDANTGTTAVVEDFTFVGTQAFTSNAPGQVRYQVDATRGEVLLYGNTDLDSGAEFAIELVGVFDFTSADFVF